DDDESAIRSVAIRERDPPSEYRTHRRAERRFDLDARSVRSFATRGPHLGASCEREEQSALRRGEAADAIGPRAVAAVHCYVVAGARARLERPRESLLAT